MHKKKILVFGSSGLVGKPLTKKLNKDFDVIQVLNPNSNYKFSKTDESIIYLDISKKIDFDKLNKKLTLLFIYVRARKNCYQEGEIDTIYNINTINPYNIALFAIENKIKTLFISLQVEFTHFQNTK